MEQGNIRKLSSGYDTFFSDLYNAHHGQMIKIARYYVGAEALAEDVVSDVFAKLWEMRDEVANIRDVRNYLFIMVKRKCLDEANRYSVRQRNDLAQIPPRLLITAGNPETAYLNHELSERLAASLQKLPDKCRTVFLLVKEDKLRYKEVARLLNISEKTVEMHVGNALKALRNDLDAYIAASKKRKSRSLRSLLFFAF